MAEYGSVSVDITHEADSVRLPDMSDHFGFGACPKDSSAKYDCKVCMYDSIYVYMCMYMCIYVCVCACMCMYVYVYVYAMYVGMYVLID